MKYVLAIILSVLSTFCICQDGSNPFDIHRTGATDKIASEPTADQGNAFDIQRHTTPQSEVTITEDSAPNKNPFEVDHVPLRRQTLAKSSSINKSTTNGNTENTGSQLFLFWLILFSCILIAFAINYGKNLISKLFKSIRNENILTSLMREENGGRSLNFMFLYLSFFINIAILAYHLSINHASALSGIRMYISCFALLFAAFIIKHMAIYFSGWLFPVTKEARVYSFSMQAYAIVLGITLIPFNLLLSYGPDSTIYLATIAAAILVFLYIILLWTRGLFTSYTYVAAYTFHFFIYLCTLELIPILLVLKRVQGC